MASAAAHIYIMLLYNPMSLNAHVGFCCPAKTSNSLNVSQLLCAPPAAEITVRALALVQSSTTLRSAQCVRSCGRKHGNGGLRDRYRELSEGAGLSLQHSWHAAHIGAD